MQESRNNARIAFFLPSLHGGGAERVMLTLANRLVALGYAVDLVLAKAEGPYVTEISPSVRLVDLNAPRVLRSLPGLILYIRRTRPAVLLSALDHANVAAGIGRMFACVPMRLVISQHSHVSRPYLGERKRRQDFLLKLMSPVYRKADRVVAVSSGVAESLISTIGMPRALIDVIYNPIVDETMLSRSREPIEHAWFECSDVPVVVAIGRLAPEKDFATLIRAFAFLCRRRKAKLIILGEGKLRSELEQLVCDLGVSEFVDMPGFVNNPYAYLFRANSFALSSIREGLPTVLIEAMACGTPVVSTDCPSGPAEILQGGKFGTLVPIGDPVALADALEASLDNPLPPSSISTRAMEFSVDNAVRRYLSMLMPDR